MVEQARTGALRRVVVTGMGAVSPLGVGVEAPWEGLCAGRSGIGRITHFDTTGYETTIAGEVRGFDPEQFLEKKEARKADRFVQFAVAASRMAVEDAGVVVTPALAEEFGLFDHLLKGKLNGRQLSSAEAVKIATINSARTMGLEKEFGSVETGKAADLVILDGDPLEDFRLIGSRVSALFMDGALIINNCGLEV